MRVIGIDPGLTRCGIGVIEGEVGRRPRFLAAGVIKTESGTELGQRLLRLERGLQEWFDEFSPDGVAVERVFSQHNVASVTDTAAAAGLGLLFAARNGLPSASYTPSEVKAAITGSGRADKSQIGVMVTRILSLAAPPKPADAADAVAIAICHFWRGNATNRLAAAVAAAKRGKS